MNTIKLGIFEILPKDKEYKNYLEFINTYSKETPNSEGIRISSSKETNYLFKTFKELGLLEFLEKYCYKFVTDIIIVYDPYGTGRYKEAIIDDPAEILKFQNGEVAIGYDSDGELQEFWKSAGKIEDYTLETAWYFIIRPL